MNGGINGMNEEQEKYFILGKIRTFQTIIIDCQNALTGLGVKLKSKNEFDQERIDVIKTLRSACGEIGDNDWSDDLHISDIINKHLVCYVDPDCI
jgi:hypothetical protein